MKKVFLRYYKAHKVNREKFLKEYDNKDRPYTLLKGAPLLLNVEGTYIMTDSLMKCCLPKYRLLVQQWLKEGGEIEWRWNRYNPNGMTM